MGSTIKATNVDAALKQIISNQNRIIEDIQEMKETITHLEGRVKANTLIGDQTKQELESTRDQLDELHSEVDALFPEWKPLA